MRNYIILNGQNSNEITGLLIQSLPPISQPKIRTNIEEIDGRDGDIITKLGYSAYNKEISIGLYGNYDVDDIIKYFTDNQSGKVTFSDEPDKYYNYEILEQIDFDKLIRYRTATVKLHCQPFKYSTTEEKIQINATEVSGSGSNITLENTEDGALFTSLQIIGDTSQDGTPTPSSPQDIHTISGSNKVVVCGKNIEQGIEQGGISNSGENYSSTTAIRSKYFNMVKPNTTYVLSMNGSPNGFNVAQYDENKNFISFTYHYGKITTAGNTRYIRVSKTATLNDEIQIEEGETVTSYEPYQSQTYDIDLGLIELCKIGDYQDYIYKENGNWYLYKAIGKYVFTGNEIGALQNSGKRFDISCSTNNIPICISNSTSGEISKIYCNILVASSGDYTWRGNQGISYNTGTKGQILVSISGATTTQAYLSALKDNYVYYVLATPTTTQITDTTLLSQLEALASATTYLGQTNIITNGDDLSPLLDVTTYAVDGSSFVITNSGNFKSKPIITIYGLGTIGLYLNGIQVLSLDMGETTSQITIDVAKLEAYNQKTGALMNRSVTGDYNNLSLNVGENTITESGTLQGIEIENYSRWL